MSDEFDKEAERKKLREKLADDDEKREHTQRMSELLLKGATMTNRHCDNCGDPIFRQDGREFCPTCHTVDAADVQGSDGPAAEGGAPEAPNSARSTGTPDPNGQADVPDPNGQTDVPDPNGPSSAGANGSASSASRTPNEGVGSGDGVSAVDALDPSKSAANANALQPGDRAENTPAGGVDDARESLARTLNRFARAAEATDDPRRARDHLQAAREAAEAIAALER